MGTITFNFVVSMLFRNMIRGRIEGEALIHNVALEMVESRGWISSQFFVKGKGNDKDILAFRDALIKLNNELGGE